MTEKVKLKKNKLYKKKKKQVALMIEEVNRYKTAELRKKLKKYKNEVKEMKDLFVDFIDLSGITYKQAEELMENRITINKLRNWKKNRNREDNNYGGERYISFL